MKTTLMVMLLSVINISNIYAESCQQKAQDAYNRVLSTCEDIDSCKEKPGKQECDAWHTGPNQELTAGCPTVNSCFTRHTLQHTCRSFDGCGVYKGSYDESKVDYDENTCHVCN